MPTPKNAAAAPPVAPSPIPAIHSRGDLAGSPCHSELACCGSGAGQPRSQPHQSRKSPQRKSRGGRQRSIVDGLTGVGPKHGAERAR